MPRQTCGKSEIWEPREPSPWLPIFRFVYTLIYYWYYIFLICQSPQLQQFKKQIKYNYNDFLEDSLCSVMKCRQDFRWLLPKILSAFRPLNLINFSTCGFRIFVTSCLIQFIIITLFVKAITSILSKNPNLQNGQPIQFNGGNKRIRLCLSI